MRISTKGINRILFTVVMLFLLAPMTVFAANKVVVIPLFGDCPASVCNPLKNIVTVGKSNGMFTDPVAAVNSITDASASNPYLVVIGPGVYMITQTLVMKPYVDIAGSGENVTTIKGAISAGSASSSVIVRGSDKSALSSLTVENTGGGAYSVALYNNTPSPRVSNVTAEASGGTINIGIYNSSSSPVMTDVTALAGGGESYAVWIDNPNSSPSTVIRRSTMSGDTNGLNTVSGTATVSQSTI